MSLFPDFIVYAVDVPNAQNCFSGGVGNIGCLPFYLKNIINAVFALSAVVTVIIILLSSIRLLLSGGDEIKIAKAKKSMTFAIIGFVIILLSFTILQIISLVTG